MSKQFFLCLEDVQDNNMLTTTVKFVPWTDFKHLSESCQTEVFELNAWAKLVRTLNQA